MIRASTTRRSRRSREGLPRRRRAPQAGLVRCVECLPGVASGETIGRSRAGTAHFKLRLADPAAATRRHGPQVAARLTAFISVVSQITEGLTEAEKEDFADIPGLDPGELLLVAMACREDDAIIVTGDKNALRTLATDPRCAKYASKLAGRVVVSRAGAVRLDEAPWLRLAVVSRSGKPCVPIAGSRWSWLREWAPRCQRPRGLHFAHQSSARRDWLTASSPREGGRLSRSRHPTRNHGYCHDLTAPDANSVPSPCSQSGRARRRTLERRNRRCRREGDGTRPVVVRHVGQRSSHDSATCRRGDAHAGAERRTRIVLRAFHESLKTSIHVSALSGRLEVEVAHSRGLATALIEPALAELESAESRLRNSPHPATGLPPSRQSA